MAISGIDSNYYSALTEYLKSISKNSTDNTQPATDTGSTGDTAAATEAAQQAALLLDGYYPGNSESGLLDSAYLNYGSSGAYSMPTLTDYLTDGSGTNDIMDLMNSGSGTDAASMGLADYLSASGNSANMGSTEIESAFDSLGEAVSVKDSQLIQEAIARITNKDNK